MPALPDKFETAFGTYERGKQLGEGGSGTVFSVRRQSDGLTFALKFLKASNKEKAGRFKNEVAFLLRTRHPNVINVEDHGVVVEGGEKYPFYVMPQYATTLRRHTLPASERLPTFATILDGVEAAHLRSVHHRDLKPENILLTPSDGSLVVADFGIAHFHEAFLVSAVETADHQRLANFQYAAPEQRRPGMKVDHRADIYALGLMLNEMFTQHIPQGAGYLRIATAAPEFGYLDDIIERMIQQDPGARPDSIDAVKSALIARRQEFVGRQKISELQQEVVPAATVTDPLVSTPVKIASFDYRQGNLLLTLNATPHEGWQNTFRRIDYGTAVWGKGPPAFNFAGNVMSIPVSAESAQQVLSDANRFVGITNAKYAEEKKHEAERRERDARERLQRNLKEEEARVALLQKLKL